MLCVAVNIVLYAAVVAVTSRNTSAQFPVACAASSILQINKAFDRIHTMNHNIQNFEKLFEESPWHVRLSDQHRKLWQYVTVDTWRAEEHLKSDRWRLLWCVPVPLRTVWVPSHILADLKEKFLLNPQAYEMFQEKAVVEARDESNECSK